MMIPAPSESELHAYLDGELASVRQEQIVTWLAEHPAEAQRLATWQAQRQQLHQVFDPVLDEEPPARLRNAARRQSPRLLIRIAAAVGWMALGALLALTVPTPFTVNKTATTVPTSPLATHAALAHLVYTPEVRHPVEVGADQEAHLVAWLSKRLGNELRIPNLIEQGYHLVGGRLLPGESGPVAQFMYEEGNGQRLTLYVRSNANNNNETAFRFIRQGKVSVFYWIDQQFGYALSAELPRNKLLGLAESSYNQLSL